MLSIIILNLKYILIAAVLLGGAWLANFVLSIYFNTKVNAENFDKKKMISGVVKIAALLIGTGLLTVLITIIPTYLQTLGIELQDEFVQAFNIIAIITIYVKSIVNYVKQSFDILSKILA